MSVEKKRPWFQIHLSTAVVLMVVAGVLVWANVTTQIYISPLSYVVNIPPNDQYDKVIGEKRGWPLAFQDTSEQNVKWGLPKDSKNLSFPGIRFDEDALQAGKHLVRLDYEVWSSPELWSKKNLALNFALALAILTAVAVGCEYLIRKREKGMKQADP